MNYSDRRDFVAVRCCERCGQPLKSAEKAGLIVGLRTLNTDNAWVGVTMREQQIVESLLRSYPEVVPHEEMYLRVWGYDSDVELKTLHAYALKVRRKLAAVGFSMETVQGVGYRLVKHVA